MKKSSLIRNSIKNIYIYLYEINTEVLLSRLRDAKALE